MCRFFFFSFLCFVYWWTIKIDLIYPILFNVTWCAPQAVSQIFIVFVFVEPSYDLGGWLCVEDLLIRFLTGVDLAKALNPEAMLPILANAEVQERLIPYLPEGELLPKTEAELRNTISSPQFQQVWWCNGWTIAVLSPLSLFLSSCLPPSLSLSLFLQLSFSLHMPICI